MTYKAGDILFYSKGTGNDIGDAIVSDVTGSNLVHCAIAVSDLLKIEEIFNGVVISPIDNSIVVCSYPTSEKAKPYDAKKAASALLWLHGEVGDGYGWTDLVNALLSHYEQSTYIDTNSYDCSSLCAEFLQRVGGTPASEFKDVHPVTPVSLAEKLGVVMTKEDTRSI